MLFQRTSTSYGVRILVLMRDHHDEPSDGDAHWTATIVRIHALVTEAEALAAELCLAWPTANSDETGLLHSAQQNLLEARGEMCSIRQCDGQDVPDDEAANDQLEAWIRETVPWMP